MKYPLAGKCVSLHVTERGGGGGYNYKAIMTIIKCFYAENESALLNAVMQKT